MFQPDRDLPAHRRLPVEGPLAGFQCGDVQCTAGATLVSRPVEEDAGLGAVVLHESGQRGRIAVRVGFAGLQVPLLLARALLGEGAGVELHVARFEPGHVVGEVLLVVVVHQMGAEAAAPETELRRRLVEDPLAAAAEDARVVRPQVRGVEDPGALLVDLVEADPLVDVGRNRHGERT